MAPRPTAILAELMPTTPPPRTTTLRAIHAGHAAEEHALAAVIMLKVGGADLGGHASGHRAHRSEKRKRAVGRLNGFVSDAHDLALHEGLGEALIGREMEIGVEDLAFAKEGVLFRQRLLDLHDHVGLVENFLRASR